MLFLAFLDIVAQNSRFDFRRNFYDFVYELKYRQILGRNGLHHDSSDDLVPIVDQNHFLGLLGLYADSQAFLHEAHFSLELVAEFDYHLFSELVLDEFGDVKFGTICKNFIYGPDLERQGNFDFVPENGRHVSSIAILPSQPHLFQLPNQPYRLVSYPTKFLGPYHIIFEHFHYSEEYDLPNKPSYTYLFALDQNIFINSPTPIISKFHPATHCSHLIFHFVQISGSLLLQQQLQVLLVAQIHFAFDET